MTGATESFAWDSLQNPQRLKTHMALRGWHDSPDYDRWSRSRHVVLLVNQFSLLGTTGHRNQQLEALQKTMAILITTPNMYVKRADQSIPGKSQSGQPPERETPSRC